MEYNLLEFVCCNDFLQEVTLPNATIRVDDLQTYYKVRDLFIGLKCKEDDIKSKIKDIDSKLDDVEDVIDDCKTLLYSCRQELKRVKKA